MPTVSAAPLALLVDGDNLPASRAGRIVALARGHGALRVRRIYGDLTRVPAWCAAPGFRQIHAGTGKNATDMLIAIDAMDLAHGGGIGGVVIASSDRDFAHLAHNLVEKGLLVVGIGEAKTPEAFRKACSRFHELAPGGTGPSSRRKPAKTNGGLPVASTEAPALPSPAPEAGSPEAAVAALLQSTSDGRGYTLSMLKQLLDAETRARMEGAADGDLRQWFAARPAFFEIDAGPSEARIRLR